MAETDTSMTGYVDAERLKEDIAIDPTNLSDDMRRHASTYTHYAVQAVRARRQYERYKAAFEILEAQLDGELRTRLKEENPKTTEPQIKAAIVQDARYKAGNAQVISAQEVFRLAEVAERAFEHRKDMLLQLARDAAREAEGQLRVSIASTRGEGARDSFLSAAAKNREQSAASSATG